MSTADPANSAPSAITSSPGPGAKRKARNRRKGGNKLKDLAQTDGAQSPLDSDQHHTDEPGSPALMDASDNVPSTDNDDNADNTSLVNVNGTGNGHATPPAPSQDDPIAKLEALGKEREALMVEVQQLRRQLEGIQESHEEEFRGLRNELEESNSAKEKVEEQYQTLLERVERIKSTLSDRLKRDKQELEEVKERAEELETENDRLRTDEQSSAEEISRLKSELQDSSRELTTLRSRNNLSAQNWLKEKDEYARLVQHLKEEVDTTANAMSEWEVIAMEERSHKQSLEEKTLELEEELVSLRESHQSATREKNSLSAAADNLQNALREIQEARKKELREMVEASQEESKAMKDVIRQSDARAAEAEAARERLAKELERMAPFEKEVKEKNLLIGKLRHEAIVLNDHLTKALRYLKKTKPEDNVDRQVITNHLLHFLTLDRSDPKRFQILQVMAGYLAWNDEQREQAGLSRPGTSGTSSLRLHVSPFNRSPSTASLNEIFTTDQAGSGAGKESLADLWAGFLERSVEEASSEGPRRKDSASSAATGTTKGG